MVANKNNTATSIDCSLAHEIPSLQPRHLCTSLASSPHKLGKVGTKQEWTVDIRKLSSDFTRLCENPVPVNSTEQMLALEGFQESNSEA